jgi:predicted RNA-binding Zn-ribbon protein involved in translation (DUF1610 family)
MDEIREQAELNRRIERIEEALYTAGLLIRPVIIEPQAPPLVPCSIVGTPFRGSPLHPFTTTASFVCPACCKESVVTIYAKGRGISVAGCPACKQQIVRLDLQW